MTKPAPFAFWKQTRFNTCGPACLMTALNELGRSGLSRRRELEIWKRVRHPLSLGSLPARMAAYAAGLGLSVALLRKDLSPPDRSIHWKTPRRSLHKHLLRAYYFSAREEESRGLDVRLYGNEKELLERMLGNPGLRIIYLVIDDDGYLHFILAREKAGRIAVMDPYYGRNFLFDQPYFLNRLGPAMVGYATLLAL